MAEKRRLMCVLAHPDDESLGTGGILARYAAEGVETHLVTATRGERGWFGDPRDNPGPTALGAIRQQELLAAAAILGLHEVSFLDYHDGDLDQAEPAEVINHLVTHLRRVRPQVVVTFDPNGGYGHPDHIAISQFTTAAVVAAAGPDHPLQGVPHQVSKLYSMVETQEKFATYQKAFGDLVIDVDGVERRASGWQPWAITTHVDTVNHWQQVWQAVFSHRSQLPGYRALQALSVEQRREMWATQSFYRVFSLVNGGRVTERDLFEGIDRDSIDENTLEKLEVGQ